jgi:hypothetical protein
MKEEELRMKHDIHIHMYRYEIKKEEQQTINTKVIMEFGNSCLRLRALSQWAFLFLFEALNVHQESANGLKK